MSVAFSNKKTLLQLQSVMKSSQLVTEVVFCLSTIKDKNSGRKSKLDRAKSTHISIRTPETSLSDLNISAVCN